MYAPFQPEKASSQGFHLRQNALVLLELLARTVLPETASEPCLPLSASCKIW